VYRTAIDSNDLGTKVNINRYRTACGGGRWFSRESLSIYLPLERDLLGFQIFFSSSFFGRTGFTVRIYDDCIIINEPKPNVLKKKKKKEKEKNNFIYRTVYIFNHIISSNSEVRRVLIIAVLGENDILWTRITVA
jgi:hypothetical protein